MVLCRPILILLIFGVVCSPAFSQANTHKSSETQGTAKSQESSQSRSQAVPGSRSTPAGQVQAQGQNQAVADAQKAGNKGIFSQPQIDFLNTAVRCLRFENEIAALEGKKGVHGKVERFSDEVAEKNGHVLYELNRLASSGYFMPISGISEQQESQKARYYNAPRGQIDLMFLSDVVRSHQKLIGDFQQAMNSGNSQVRAMAKKNLPILEETLKRAQSLQDAVK